MLESLAKYFELLASVRKSKKLTQHAFAKKMGIPQGYLSKIENHKVNIKLSNFVEMVRLLDHEVMLIPRSHITLVKALLNTQKTNEPTPAYSLKNDEDPVTKKRGWDDV